jgi:transcriptional regulator of acetoin/glycerol metabolism
VVLFQRVSEANFWTFKGSLQVQSLIKLAILKQKRRNFVLDEIGNLTYENQVQLFALQGEKIKPVGSNKEIAVDIRNYCDE